MTRIAASRQEFHLENGDVVAIKPREPGKKCLPDEQPYFFEIIRTERQQAFWAACARKLQGKN